MHLLLRPSLFQIPVRYMRGHFSKDGLLLQSRSKPDGLVYSLLSPLVTSYKNVECPPLPELGENEVTSISSRIMEDCSAQLKSGCAGRLFAVVHFRGHQRLVKAEDVFACEGHFPADIGTRIRLEKVLIAGSRDFTLVGRPVLANGTVAVEATVIEKTVDHSKAVYRFKTKEKFRRFRLHQSPMFFLRINSITIDPQSISGSG